MPRSTDVFQGSGVSWYQTPHWLFKEDPKTGKSYVAGMSAGAKSLYDYLLHRMNKEGSAIVTVATTAIINVAGVSKNRISEARNQLEKLGLIRVISLESGKLTVEVLNPRTGGSLPSTLKEKLAKAREYTHEEIEAIFMRYLGEGRLDDNKNGMKFICPWHTIGVNSFGKRTANPLSVKFSTRGVWQCTSQTCKRHGRKRFEEVRDGYNELTGIKVSGGGGDILDFITAMNDLEGKEVTREKAATIIEQILHPVP